MTENFQLDETLNKDIYNFLRNLPEDETAREYEKRIVDFVLADQESDITPYLQQLVEGSDDRLAFSAFCALCEKLRRTMDYSKQKSLLDKYADRFADHPFIGHIKLLYHMENFDYTKRDEIIELARQNAIAMFENCGALHAFAYTVAQAFEHNWTYHLNDPPAMSVLEEALTFVELAISKDSNYAKYYCTKGRLLSFKGQYADGLKMVQKAIDLEDSGKTDYAIRISNYIHCQQQIQTREQNSLTEQYLEQYLEQKLSEYTKAIDNRQDDLENTAKKITEEMRGSIIKNLEFIGLFAGIISFTIGSISISSNLASISFVGAAGLIIVLMGALLCVFSGFGVILHGFKKGNRMRNFSVFITGVLLTAVGLYICCIVPKIL